MRQLLSFLAVLALAGTGHAPDLQADNRPDRLTGHGGPVQAVALSTDGQEALSASFDYSIIHWRMTGIEGTIINRLIGHDAAVNDVAFLPGDTRAVSVSDDGSLGVWDLPTGALVTRIAGCDAKALDVAVSPDGKRAASACWDGTARVFDLDTLAQTARLAGHRGNVNAVAFSNDGRRLFTGSVDGMVRAIPADGSGDPRVLHSHGWGINVLALLPDGKRLVFGTLNGDVGVIDLITDQVEMLGEYERPILSLAVSRPAGWFAAGGADGRIRVYDSLTYQLREDHEDPFGPVWGMAFTPDGTRIYRSGLDDHVTHWHVAPRVPFEHVDSVYPRRFQVQAGADPGAVEFQRKCSVCHTLTPDDANRAGPTLYRLFGRRAGSVEGYIYSEALKRSDIVWTEETVARLFDDGPDVVTPGTKMPIQRLKDVQRRDALIAFLKRATEPASGAHDAVE